jgi:flavin reductase (DIM6/NTAB) family NADH-FMN oxidoreductase RutF
VVTFNIAVPSRTFDAVAASRRFNIHVLADDAAGARVADWLAGGNAGGAEVLERLAADGGVEVELGEQEGDAPMLKGDGVLYVLRCRLLEDANAPAGGFVRVRDHVIVLGEVLEMVEGSRTQREVKERFGLLYADRRYRQLGKCITPVEKEKEGSEIDEG